MQSSARQSWVWSLRIHCWDYHSLLQKQHDHKNHRDHGQDEGNRHDSLLAHNVASQYCGKASAPARIVNVSSLGQQVKITVNPMQGALNLSRPPMPTADEGERFAQGSYYRAAQHWRRAAAFVERTSFAQLARRLMFVPSR